MKWLLNEKLLNPLNMTINISDKMTFMYLKVLQILHTIIKENHHCYICMPILKNQGIILE